VPSTPAVRAARAGSPAASAAGRAEAETEFPLPPFGDAVQTVWPTCSTRRSRQFSVPSSQFPAVSYERAAGFSFLQGALAPLRGRSRARLARLAGRHRTAAVCATEWVQGLWPCLYNIGKKGSESLRNRYKGGEQNAKLWSSRHLGISFSRIFHFQDPCSGRLGLWTAIISDCIQKVCGHLYRCGIECAVDLYHCK